MKINLLIIAIVAILVTACTTGTQMTRTYDDDIYFSPGDVPPVSMASQDAQERTSNSDARNQRMVISELEQNDDGTKTLNNYIYESDESGSSDNQAYDMDQQELSESDTTIYYNDDDVKTVINNYYDDSDLDFTYRIHRFHRPYYYSPFFYDDWNYGLYSGYYPGYSGWGWGHDAWYYSGWGYPYSYGYYSPFAFGFGSYWGGGYGGYGGYYNGYYDGYYGGYYGSGGGGFYNDRDVARRRPTEMNMPNRNSQNNNQIGGNRTSGLKGGSYGNDSDQQLPRGVSSSSGYSRGRVVNANGSNNGDTKNATIVNNRRPGSASGTQVQTQNGSRTQVARPATSTSGNVRRSYEPSTTGRTYNQGRPVTQGQNYTPSYNKPRIVNQSNYNNNSYTRPRTSGVTNERGAVVKSAPATGNPTYSAPRSSSSMRQTYRSSQSYSSGSSSSPSRSSSPSYSRSPSSSPSYSSPAPRSSGSSSSGSYSGGSSSGSSSGGSSGGGGGSGHRR